jgi:hypothetical protein
MATLRPPASGSPDLRSLLLGIGGAGSLGVGGTDGAPAARNARDPARRVE